MKKFFKFLLIVPSIILALPLIIICGLCKGSYENEFGEIIKL